MKSIVKTALTISVLFTLPGCMDFGWFNKKEEAPERVEAVMPAHGDESASKCSHKGCTHDHSKDNHKKHHNNHKKHDGDVHTQGMDDEDENDIEIQAMYNPYDDDNDNNDDMEDQN